jgi:thiamine-monophosphate kinase
MKLSQIGELYLLERIRKNFSKKSKNILVGIGDDAAVISPITKNTLLTTDMMVEGIHFDPSFITPYQLGFKLISANVSDIYAMGGKPLYVLLNIALKKDTTLEFVDNFFEGIRFANKHYGTILVGGDISATHTSLSFSATLLGYAERYLNRTGACIGDRIYVTGNLGDSACGLAILKRIKKQVPINDIVYEKKIKRDILKGLSWKTIEPLLRRHLMPEARNPEKIIYKATSMIDISDGLLIDLTRLCNESKVGAKICLDKIPLSAAIKRTSEYLGISPVRLALAGGEDYELLFTASPGKRVKAICIGEITKSERVIIDSHGKKKPFSVEGYQHFGSLNPN